MLRYAIVVFLFFVAAKSIADWLAERVPFIGYRLYGVRPIVAIIVACIATFGVRLYLGHNR
jgi:hypothetical protein